MEWIMRPHTLSPLPPFDWLFLTDAGLETDLIYNQGIDLPFFASISLLRTESGRQALKDYYRPYLELAARHGAGFRSEEHTSELQSLMRISYAVFCLKKKQNTTYKYVIQ